MLYVVGKWVIALIGDFRLDIEMESDWLTITLEDYFVSTITS
jgi:hypothetical protein